MMYEMTSLIDKITFRIGRFETNNNLLVAGTTALVAVASCVWYYLPRCPKAYRDRLKGPQKVFGEDNVMNYADYQSEEYWSVSGMAGGKVFQERLNCPTAKVSSASDLTGRQPSQILECCSSPLL